MATNLLSRKKPHSSSTQMTFSEIDAMAGPCFWRGVWTSPKSRLCLKSNPIATKKFSDLHRIKINAGTRWTKMRELSQLRAQNTLIPGSVNAHALLPIVPTDSSTDMHRQNSDSANCENIEEDQDSSRALPEQRAAPARVNAKRAQRFQSCRARAIPLL